MANRHHIPLSHRSLIAVSGEDRTAFLQGLVSCDVTKVAPDRALYGAFLTPQGKFLHDFFLASDGDTLLLECETDRRGDFVKRLTMYRLRSKAQIAVSDTFHVHALIGDDAAAALGLANDAGSAKAFAGGVAFVDPRLAAGGVRAWLPAGSDAAVAEAGFAPAEPAVWDIHRIGLGLPDGSRDIVPDKTLLLEAGFDELRGVDWQKGCYLGQELTARTKYRGLVRKRLLPVDIEGPAPEAGTPVLLDGAEAGEMRSHAGTVGLAMIRLDSLEQLAKDGGTLHSGAAVLSVKKPDWLEC